MPVRELIEYIKSWKEELRRAQCQPIFFPSFDTQVFSLNMDAQLKLDYITMRLIDIQCNSRCKCEQERVRCEMAGEVSSTIH